MFDSDCRELAIAGHNKIKMPEKDKTADYPVGPDGKKLKPCCACPETKKVRDECIMEKVSLAGVERVNC